jgi:hypothetical protein
MKTVLLGLFLTFVAVGGVVADSVYHPAKAIPSGSVGKAPPS